MFSNIVSKNNTNNHCNNIIDFMHNKVNNYDKCAKINV